tara:strand:- start:587 stop:817 length:231 start_codon:yes stop_codon:yes gene_type:complete
MKFDLKKYYLKIIMPYSLATCMALKFVRDSSLKTRMKFMEYSYKYQFASLLGLTFINLYPLNIDIDLICENYLLTT